MACIDPKLIIRYLNVVDLFKFILIAAISLFHGEVVKQTRNSRANTGNAHPDNSAIIPDRFESIRATFQPGLMQPLPNTSPFVPRPSWMFPAIYHSLPPHIVTVKYVLKIVDLSRFDPINFYLWTPVAAYNLCGGYYECAPQGPKLCDIRSGIGWEFLREHMPPVRGHLGRNVRWRKRELLGRGETG